MQSEWTDLVNKRSQPYDCTSEKTQRQRPPAKSIIGVTAAVLLVRVSRTKRKQKHFAFASVNECVSSIRV